MVGYLVHLLAVIFVHILPGNIGVKLLELTKVFLRRPQRLYLVVVAYPIEEAYRDSAVDVLQGGFPVERLHEGLPAGVCEGSLPRSGLASAEHFLVEAAEQLPLAQDAWNIDLGGVGVIWRDEVHLANLLAKGGMALSAERFGPPLDPLPGSFSVERVEEAGVVGGPVLCGDASGTLQVVERRLGHPGGSGSQHSVKVSRRLLKAS